MQGIRHILIATDFSDGAHAALHEAVRLVQQWKAEFSVLHVTDDMKRARKVTSDEDKLRSIEGALLKQANEKLRTIVGGLDIEPTHTAVVETEWSIERAINAYAHEHGCDLVLISTHGDLTLAEAVRGTIASRLLRTCSLPILTVRPDIEPGFSRVLVAVDFEANAARCVELAAWICAQAEDCELHLIHANQLPGHALMNVMNNVPGEDFQSEIQVQLGHSMQSFLDKINLYGVEPTRVFSENSAHYAILKYVEEQDIDLVCLGTRAHGSLEAFFVGSTAEKVLRDVDCTVLTVHGKSV